VVNVLSGEGAAGAAISNHDDVDMIRCVREFIP